jgi:TnsA endonuclease-like protein
LTFRCLVVSSVKGGDTKSKGYIFMGKKQYWNSDAKNSRWIKEGRGQGTGGAYKPWLTVRDVPSMGRSHRIFGHLTQRTHHLLSDLELAAFLLIQWRKTVIDIREQFPLDSQITKQICQTAGISHPTHFGVPQYMSTDLLVNANDDSHPVFAIQVKPCSALKDQRSVEKLEVERRYWLEKEVPFYLVTEKQIPRVVFENIDWLYSLQEDKSSVDEELSTFEQYSIWLKQYQNMKIIDLCKQLDTSYVLELGESLFMLRRLLAKRYYHFDISIPFRALRCCDLISEPVSSVGVINVSN